MASVQIVAQWDELGDTCPDECCSICAGVEEISRQAGSRTGPGFPPEIDSLMSELFGGGAGRGAPAGGAPRSARGPGAGGLMDILQSPALQQMFGGGPGLSPACCSPMRPALASFLSLSASFHCLQTFSWMGWAHLELATACCCCIKLLWMWQ